MRDKKDARFEQLIAGALVKFEKIDYVGLTLLSGGLGLSGVTLSDGPIIDIGRYITIEDGNVSLKEGLSLDNTMCGYFTLREKLDNYQGDKIRKYLASLNIKNFIMRKIREYPSIPVEKKENYFSGLEISYLEELLKDGYLTVIWNDDYIPEDFQEYKLTKKGEVALFKEDNIDLLTDFILTLESACYDPSLLDDFLMAQNLHDQPQELLTLYNYEIFGDLYDRNILSDNADLPQFKPLHYEPKTGYDEESKTLINDLLGVLESDHSVMICHPNHIFKNKPVTKETPVITRINWDNINPLRMLQYADYGEFVDVNKAYQFAHRRLRHQILPAINNGDKDVVKYLAVVEKYVLDGEDNYVVRGLIKGDISSINIAFNPEYAKTITHDIWSRGLRMGDHNTPELYLKKHPSKEE